MLKYESIAQDIEAKIVSGELRPNDRLPIMSELCERYGVSKITVKKAMDILVSRGLVIKRRGSGSFVKDVSASQIDVSRQDIAKQLAGFSGEYSNVEVSSIVNDFSVVTPPDDVAAQLRIGPNDFAYHICRTRLADGVPQVVEYNYMPINVIPGLTIEHVQSSVYDYVEGDLGLTIASAHRAIRAVMPTKQERLWLQVPPSMPLLEVKQVAYLSDGRIFEYSVMRHVGDRYVFYSISTR
ncbi:MAG: GntR family transcriptional regulator [Atopobiaceae bacterium]